MDDQPSLDPQDEAYIDEAVKSGRYAERADVISDGLQLVREREAWLAAVRAGVQRGLDDVAAGRVVDLDEAFDQVEAMLDEMEAARRGMKAVLTEAARNDLMEIARHIGRDDIPAARRFVVALRSRPWRRPQPAALSAGRRF